MGAGLGLESLKLRIPSLVYVRISGYSLTGPYAQRSGYASTCEGFYEFRCPNEVPGEPPVRMRPNLGDSLSDLHAAFGIVLGLMHREGGQSASAQVVDVALFEFRFKMLEAVVPECDGAGFVREPSGSTVTAIAPTNTYPCPYGTYVIIGGNGDSTFQRLMHAADRPDMAEDSKVENEAEIDATISVWTTTLDSTAVLANLEDAHVSCSPIYGVADMVEDRQFEARELFESVVYDRRTLKIPAITPKLNEREVTALRDEGIV